MAKYKAYPEYKDSGVEWLGEIPGHWRLSKLRYQFAFGKGLTITKEHLQDEGIPCVNYGEVHSKYGFEVDPKIHTLKCVSDKYLKDNFNSLLFKGDIVFADTSEDIDGSGNFTQLVSDATTFAGYHTIIARPFERNNSRFYAYLLDCIELRTQVQHAVKGVKVFSITQAILRNLSIWLPSKDEQEQIATFLDHETAKIDNLIEKQQQLIELLKEKRQAVISHAVTKGLNPDAPMKDSGVEWLGEVPEHWIVSGFKKYLSSIVDYRGKTPNKTDDGILLVTARNIKKGVLDYTLSQEFVAPSDYKEVMGRGLPDIGDVLFTTEAPLGEVANVDRVDIALAQRIIKFKGMISRLDNYYFKYFIMSSAFQQSLNLYSSGSTAQGIKAERFVYLRKLLPPINEQMEIVGFLDKEITKIDILVEQQFVMLSLLQERRTALISAAVTGKIDVRDWVAPDTQDVEESQEATA
ncbi:TPA: restriction endonuclease subunit S [Klebsiella quasipneumoniae]|uniref:restriction endonuclease subunit S n=1 Tax=Klebsiella TaxID=570 RepID=UPI0013F937AF|nr:restriction endonuclease subunit S [Klebsiella quasipneumoniae]HBR1223857.1 restriction endonuclease subunit S [Klebsiella quasipneumoniae subsp. similipneumoniae]HCT5907736.1 restriction endonuclease subunit S [Klebsiella pneumoniae]NGX14548.1 restriction endonuclease subunit S [Klebsiella quasipneumoniae]NGX21678.1 restriction endonuclease subunit S [Klebsiella quasipneumoniae]NGX23867.1 restriction endonuclease subunit S [Klebsiella quasipneumoniae]